MSDNMKPIRSKQRNAVILISHPKSELRIPTDAKGTFSHRELMEGLLGKETADWLRKNQKIR